jgi:hypothetical protein
MHEEKTKYILDTYSAKRTFRTKRSIVVPICTESLAHAQVHWTVLSEITVFEDYCRIMSATGWAAAVT